EPGLPADAANGLLSEMRSALGKGLAEILTARQARRLRQLERQHAGLVAFRDPENQRLLGLTEGQRGKVEVIVDTALKAIAATAHKHQPLAPDGGTLRGGFPVVPNDVVPTEGRDAEPEERRKAEKAAADQILQLLTANQKQIWCDLVGESVDL